MWIRKIEKADYDEALCELCHLKTPMLPHIKVLEVALNHISP